MKKPTLLSEKLRSYSLLTGGLIVSSAAGNAQVIYTDVNPDYTGNFLYDAYFNMDLNGDGITDFTMFAEYHSGSNSVYSIGVFPGTGNAVAVLSNGAQALGYGDTINQDLQWDSGSLQVLAIETIFNTPSGYITESAGNWIDVANKYIGIRFTFNSETHYGWIRLSVEEIWEYTVHDYAYEAVPDSSIAAAEVDCMTWYPDTDADGFGDQNDIGEILCYNPGAGYSPNDGDCDDSDNAINPLATEVCDNIDDNCNGTPDDGLVFVTYYADTDEDLYGDLNNFESDCNPISGFVTDSTDCDDTNASVNPGVTEIANNGIDDNCNGDVDEFGVGVSSIENNEDIISVFPNPNDSEFVLAITLGEEINTEATIEVINLLGQIVHAQRGMVVKGKLQRKIHLSKIAQGTYLVKVIAGDHVCTTMLVHD